VGVRVDHSLNVLQHTVDVLQDVVVPVAHHSIAIRFENPCALGIGSRLRCVLTAINLNDHAPSMAGEIDDVAVDPNLTSEMRAWHSKAMTQVPPQFALGFGGSAPHLLRQLALRRHLCAVTLCPDSWFIGGHNVNSGCLFHPHRWVGVPEI
jgi:hypothetical protein